MDYVKLSKAILFTVFFVFGIVLVLRPAMLYNRIVFKIIFNRFPQNSTCDNIFFIVFLIDDKKNVKNDFIEKKVAVFIKQQTKKNVENLNIFI